MNNKIISTPPLFVIDSSRQYKGYPIIDYSEYLLNMPQILSDVNNIAAHFNRKGVTKVIGIADKGLIFAELIAHQLGLPLVVAGEGHKMPGQMLSVDITHDDNKIKYLQIFRGVISADYEVYGVVDEITTSGETLYDTIKTLEDYRSSNKSCGATCSFISNVSAINPNYDAAFAENVHVSAYLFQNETIHPSRTPISSPLITPPNYLSFSTDELKKEILVYINKLRGSILWTNFDHILANQQLMNSACDYMIEPYRNQKIDKVVSLAVRGFHFGALIAKKLGAGIVLAEKREKILSDDIESKIYGMEYAEQLEMAIRKGLIKPGDRILIIDDILATGGTLNATIELVERFGATVVGASCLIKINHVFEDKNFGNKVDNNKYQITTPLEFSKQELEEKEKEHKQRIRTFIK